MKASNYNFFIPYDYEKNKYIAYNALSNSLALIEEDKYKKYLDFESSNIEIDDEKLLEDLAKGSFIIDDNLDELKVISHDMYRTRFNTTHLSLTIAPTSDCNFRCSYCFEKNAINSCYMSEDTENSIVKMLENRSGLINNFHVTWYGGEPLLAVDTIKRLSERFIKICDDNKINFSATIVTNGYNLSRKNWTILKYCKVTTIQITVDGDEETHNKRRPLVGNLPTFDKIIKNLVDLKDDIIPVTLRINIDKTNINQIEKVLETLKENNLTNAVIPYLARVDNFNDCFDDNYCLRSNEFKDIVERFCEKMQEYGYSAENSKKYSYPRRLDCVCGCDVLESYVINADGEMYKCWNDIGKKDISIGNVSNNFTGPNKLYLDYMMHDPTLDEKCSKCKFLPICMGGCSSKRLSNPYYVCDDTKYKFQERLNNIALQIKSKINKDKEKIS